MSLPCRKYNDFPFNANAYTLKRSDDYDLKRESWKKNLIEVYNDTPTVSDTISQVSKFNPQTTEDVKYKDYFYPVKPELASSADSGWVYFGTFDITDTTTFQTQTEAFYRKAKLLWVLNFSDEINENFTINQLKGFKLSPLEVLYLRDQPSKRDGKIIGEVYPENTYMITGDYKTYLGKYLWVKVKRITG